MPFFTRSPSAGGLTFSHTFDSRKNAFAFLRLFLAVAVIFSHTYPLGGFGLDPLEIATGGQYTIGLLAVAMFFVLSGFLICRSASGSISVGRFLWHRFLRIFPGYWVCLILCACVFAPFVALVEFDAPLRVFSAPWNSPQSFMWKNAALFHGQELSIGGILFIRPDSIAGLLRNNPVPFTINGSLWTLPFEGACYLGVAVLLALGVLRRARLIILLISLGFGGLHAFNCLYRADFQRYFPYPGVGLAVMLPLFFLAGCLCFLYREKIPHSTAVFVACLVASGVSLRLGCFELIAPLTITYLCLWLAFTLPLRAADARGDFSYGAYIYAFPVQQGFALLHLQNLGFVPYFLCSLLLTAFLAFLSHRLIEAPALRWKAIKRPNFAFRRNQPVECDLIRLS